MKIGTEPAATSRVLQRGRRSGFQVWRGAPEAGAWIGSSRPAAGTPTNSGCITASDPHIPSPLRGGTTEPAWEYSWEHLVPAESRTEGGLRDPHETTAQPEYGCSSAVERPMSKIGLVKRFVPGERRTRLHAPRHISGLLVLHLPPRGAGKILHRRPSRPQIVTRVITIRRHWHHSRVRMRESWGSGSQPESIVPPRRWWSIEPL